MGRRSESTRGRPSSPRPIDPRRGLPRLAIVLVVLTGTLTAPAAAQSATPADTTLQVTLQETGDATLRLVLSFPTATAADREALAMTEANVTELGTQFRDGLAVVADRTATTSGREQSISAPTTTVRSDGDRGVVELAVTWHGLATVQDGELRLDAPFGDGFRPPGRFVLEAPDGYRFDAVSPPPTEASPDTLVWAAGTPLDGFAVTATPDAGPAGGGSLPMPGFGVTVALTVLVGLALLAARARA